MDKEKNRRILELTKKKIAVDEFRKLKDEKTKKIGNSIKKFSVGIAAVVVLSIGSVGVYAKFGENSTFWDKIRSTIR